MAEIDPKAIARRHYQRRIADPAVSTLDVSIEARRELRVTIAQARAHSANLDRETVRDLERALDDELLAAAGHSDG